MTKLEERVQLFKDAIEFKPVKRVPRVSSYYTWIILQTEYSLDEALHDLDLLYKIIADFFEKNEFDSLNWNGSRNPIRVAEALDACKYIIKDDKIEFVDCNLMNEDEYGEFIADRPKFIWEKLFARKAKALSGENPYEHLAEAAKEYKKFQEFGARVNQKLTGELGMCRRRKVAFNPAPEELFQVYRGIAGFGMDMRRHPEELKEAMDIIHEQRVKPALEKVRNDKEPNTVSGFDFGTAILAHSIMSPKQFEKFYWPYLKPYIDLAQETGKKLDLFVEAEMLRFYEFFQDIPKGVCSVWLENDDVFEFRKKLPNICICGGMKTSLLGNGTKEECVDYAKELIDRLGTGFIFSADKMISYKNDAKLENVVAVNEFVRDFRF